MIEPVARAAPAAMQGAPQPLRPGDAPSEASRAPAQEAARLSRLETALNARLAPHFPPNTRLSVSVDGATGAFVYRTVDTGSGEVVRQWPLQQLLDLAGYLRELEALQIDKRA